MAKEEIKIRDVKATDLPDLGQIYAEAFNNADVGESWNPEHALELLTCLYSHKPNIFLVTEINGKIVGGFLGVIKPFFGKNDLCDTELFVSPKHQNLGIGRKLFKEIINKAVSKYDVKYIQGIADSEKEFPMKWYKKLGLKSSRWVHIYGEVEEILKNLNKE